MFSSFSEHVKIILNVFSLVFVQEKSHMIMIRTSLEDNVCLSDRRIFPSELSTTTSNYHFKKINAVFTTFKITFRRLV